MFPSKHQSARTAVRQRTMNSSCQASVHPTVHCATQKGKEPVYAVVVLASAHSSGNGLTITVDKLSLLSLRYRDDGQVASVASWEDEHTPYNAKKAKR